VCPRPYPPEFCRRALDLVASGRTVRDAAASLGIAESCLHGWTSRDMIDRGLRPGITPSESTELAAHRRTRELEEENPHSGRTPDHPRDALTFYLRHSGSDRGKAPKPRPCVVRTGCCERMACALARRRSSAPRW
jgi:transposase-like protein